MTPPTITTKGFPMQLWLDDVRPAPDGWTVALSVNAAIGILSSSAVVEASLDHDLGDYAPDGGDGYHLVLWMAEHETWPTRRITVHSANPVGRQRMLSVIDSYGPYRPGYGVSRET